jgi:threonylcarbamoyladenosine tRNA methylthiotransferase MtaB
VSRFHVENFGCRATQADGAAIERQLLDRGLTRAETSGEAEVVVLNTCTVTSSADQDARATIRRIHRENPSARILVTGCYAQRAPQEIAQIPGVSLVIGNSHKHQLGDLACGSDSTFVPLGSVVAAEPEKASVVVGDIFAHTELLAAPVFDSDNEKTRPNLKVQDGCSNRCSFCVIPYVRGRSRSLGLGECITNVNTLVANGYHEIVMSGINLGRWGRDLGSATIGGEAKRFRFVDLLRAVLADTAVAKVRISSVEPMDWSDDLIALVAESPRLCKHAHVPLQSGSDNVLRKMRRKYRPWHYEDRIHKIRAAMPDAAIGADVMVGFPGESDEDFEQTRAFIESLPFTYLHVFTYSGRPGMPSTTMPDQVPVQVARARNKVLRELAAEKKCRFQESLVGKTLEAITLTARDLSESGEVRTEALTDNYQKLWLAGEHEPNTMIRAEIVSVEGEALVGSVANS